MGYGDNRRTPKMNQRKRQTKLHLRLKRRALEVRAQRQSKNPTQAAEPAGKKSKVKTPTLPAEASAADSDTPSGTSALGNARNSRGRRSTGKRAR